MPVKCRLLSLATAVPPNVLRQSDVAAAAHGAFGARFGDFDRLSKVYASSGIVTRHAVRPIEWYLKPLGWENITEAYLEGATELFVRATQRCLASAGLRADEIDAVVTVSSTGIATPGLDARAAKTLGLRSDVERVPVFGLGCAGGVSGLSIASRMAAARPGAVVLMVAVELCTLAFRMDQLTKANIVATALFGDGAAACLLRVGEGDQPAVEFSGQHLWADTLDIMGWDVDQAGLRVIFDRAIPPFAAANLRPAVESVLARGELTLADVDRVCCHPGGAKVVDAIERALDLPDGSLRQEREVLARYGNMSAPTVIFVLSRLMAEPLPRRTLLTALGPGFTTSCLSLTNDQ